MTPYQGLNDAAKLFIGEDFRRESPAAGFREQAGRCKIVACIMGVMAEKPALDVRPQSVRAEVCKTRLGRILIAVSLANLCFISSWQRRLYGSSFFSPSWSWADVASLFLNVLLLALLLYLLLAISKKITLGGWGWEGLVYCIPLFAVVNVARRIAFPYHGRVAAAVLVALPPAIGIAVVVFRRRLLPAVEFILMALVILFPVNLFRLTLVAAKYHRPPPLAARIVPPAAPGPRVVWMVFDEMDYALSFPRRPADLRLPQFDQLRANSLFATDAHQPASDTEKALPSIISGRDISGFPEAQGRQTLLVRFSPQGAAQDWAGAPNIFADARAASVNVGIVGWYLPYCRMFAKVITDCYWEPIYSSVTDTPAFGRSFVDELDALTPLESRVRLIQRLRHMVKAADTMANDPQLGLVFIHLPVPHAPEIYDRRSGRLTPYALHKDWFFDNLVIADQTLGQIRSSMQRTGLWDKSAIILTSDHSLREGMMAHPHPVPLVPFMVKMPGQSRGTTFDSPFTTEIIRPLVEAILRGEVTAANLPDWMRQHSR